MYAIHTTAGLIINSRPYGDAGKLLSIFTRDFGLITATAQGIRFEKSKLRAFVQDYTLGEYSFVKGKEFWRLTGAEETLTPSTIPPDKKDLIARITLILNRFLQGEEPHPELFVAIETFYTFLCTRVDLVQELEKTLESLIVVRILHRLGYVASIDEYKTDIVSNDMDIGILARLTPHRISLNQHINKALRESHL